MASSSSSSRPSHSTPASSSQSWNHDVFLSFRGDDTRKTFVDHLYSALDQQGIYTYKDDITLPRGESIGSSLEKSIEESQIAIIVFSKNYADSAWCLDELAYIMKCRNEREQTVMPIFYDVDPSDVRKQNGEFGKAFAKQELENSNKLESWRKALECAANLSGWVPKHIANGHESECIKEIVSTISRTLLHVMSRANSNLIGIKTRLEDLKSQLEIGSRDVRMVGIWGIGGGGKTTLASSLYQEISCNFDGCSFVENIREESSKYDLKKLQAQILSDVLTGQSVDVRSVEEGKNLLKRRLCRKSVLVILDDVDSHDQLEALAGSHDWFGEGSRIIITTRNVHLLEAHRATMIHDVSLLTNDEAIQLFSRHAFGACSPVEGYEELSVNVVSKADGLPLALKIFGCFLCRKKKSEWMSALDRLNDIPDSRVIDKLKISYDGLQPDEKELFLDIACFFRRSIWHSKDEAMEILDACGFHPVIGVKVLVQKALITITEDGKFDMHDLVQEMGHHIVRGEHRNNPEKHSRVWLEEDVGNMCIGDAITENDKIEALRTSNRSPRLLEVVANMKKLRFLYVDNNFGFDRQPVTAPKFFSNELRYIYLRGYPASSLPTNFQPMKLCALMLENSLLKQLWKGCQRLSSLKVLNLRHSRFLIRTPDFEGLPNLERLMLSNCSHLKEIHPSIGYLEMLVCLDLHSCPQLKMFPPIIRMKKLETLNLSCCLRLCKFPEIKVNMDSLRHLNLFLSGIEVVPSSIGQYCTNLVSINLSRCSRLKSIEGNFRFLNRLRRLNLSGCEQLEKLPKDFFEIECGLEELFSSPVRRSLSFEHLIRRLFLMSCIGLQFFHRDLVRWELPHLPRFLRKLDLSRCNLEDGEILSDIGELSNLQELVLCENEFSRLPSGLSQFSLLKFLNLTNCKRLVELPELPSSIAILQANGCDSLETVGDLLTNCKWLRKVSICGKNKVIGGERLLQSMLKGKGIENHFMSLGLGGQEIPKGFVPSLVKGNTFTLQLPQNWYNDYSGFLLCTAMIMRNHLAFEMIIKLEMRMDSQYELWQESNEAPGPGYFATTYVGYISFNLLRHAVWWNSIHNMISFSLRDISYPENVINGLGVRLVPRRSEGEQTKIAKATTEYSESWSEEFGTFNIKHNSSLAIFWSP